MKGKFADSITIKVGQGIMTIPRNITESLRPKIVVRQKDIASGITSTKTLLDDCEKLELD